jgi:hypothetical protein
MKTKIMILNEINVCDNFDECSNNNKNCNNNNGNGYYIENVESDEFFGRDSSNLNFNNFFKINFIHCLLLKYPFPLS